MRTDRLIIEVLGEQHAVELLDALLDERVGRYIGGHEVTTLEALQERIAFVSAGPPADRDEVWLNFAVLLDGRVIGRIEASVRRTEAEVAYVFGPRWWGHGYATEAVAWLVQHLRDSGVERLWATVVPENQASVRLLERLGFAQVAPPDDTSLLSYDEGDLVWTL